MLDSVAKDIRYALRTLAGQRVFSLTVIFSLALGLGANAAIFTVLNAVLFKFLPVQNPQEIVQVKIGRSSGFTSAYRVETAGGSPDTCDGDDMEIPYAALYYFYN